MAYLDHAATTPVRAAAIAAMLPWMSDRAGNPSGSHRVARQARRALDDARDVVGAALGFDPGGVIFTSGGTEADNLAVLGVHARRGGRVLCSAIEHHAVLNAVVALGGELVPVISDGTVDLQALEANLDDGVSLVSVMAANNETGIVQPLADVSAIVRRAAPNALIHVDAVQAMPWLDLAHLGEIVDLVSISGHKLGAPQGVGALAVGPDVVIASRTYGGGQERGRRAGTHNVPGVVALAAAIGELVEQRVATTARVSALRDGLADRLLAEVPGLVETGGRASRANRLPGHAHVRLADVEGEALLFLLERHGVDASAAASCVSGANEPSHVLAAMGVPLAEISGSVRLTLGHSSTSADVDDAVHAFVASVHQLRDRAA